MRITAAGERKYRIYLPDLPLLDARVLVALERMSTDELELALRSDSAPSASRQLRMHGTAAAGGEGAAAADAVVWDDSVRSSQLGAYDVALALRDDGNKMATREHAALCSVRLGHAPQQQGRRPQYAQLSAPPSSTTADAAEYSRRVAEIMRGLPLVPVATTLSAKTVLSIIVFELLERLCCGLAFVTLSFVEQSGAIQHVDLETRGGPWAIFETGEILHQNLVVAMRRFPLTTPGTRARLLP